MGKFLHSNHVMGTENMEILKVVIADDEVRICQLIQALIDWDSMGMKVVGIAHNGEEACEMVRQTQPDILITDTWTSMGEEAEKEERKKIFKDYQINRQLLAAANAGAMVQHCLPAYRGQEITEEVFEEHADEIFNEAENRCMRRRLLW